MKKYWLIYLLLFMISISITTLELTVLIPDNWLSDLGKANKQALSRGWVLDTLILICAGYTGFNSLSKIQI